MYRAYLLIFMFTVGEFITELGVAWRVSFVRFWSLIDGLFVSFLLVSPFEFISYFLPWIWIAWNYKIYCVVIITIYPSTIQAHYSRSNPSNPYHLTTLLAMTLPYDTSLFYLTYLIVLDFFYLAIGLPILTLIDRCFRLLLGQTDTPLKLK